MKSVWLCLSALGLVLAIAAPAQADCQCVAEGKRYHLGEVACLSLPGGKRLARCSMVLNNSSWTKLDDACPLAFDDSEPLTLVSSDGHDHSHGHSHGHFHGDPADGALAAHDH